jgi:hypothetical protein
MGKTTYIWSLLFVVCVSMCSYESSLSAEATSSMGQSQGNPASSQSVQQSIHGTTYENQTSHFTLVVPKGWGVTDFIISVATRNHLSGPIGALGGSGGVAEIMVYRYHVTDPKEGVNVVESEFKKNFQDYHKFSEGPMKIDRKDAYFLTFHVLFPMGTLDKPTQVPEKFFVVFIPDGESVLGFICQSPESIYSILEPKFKKIVTSFHRNPE